MLEKFRPGSRMQNFLDVYNATKEGQENPLHKRVVSCLYMSECERSKIKSSSFSYILIDSYF